MSRINPDIFRANDIRGLAERDLPQEAVKRIGRGYASYVGDLGVSKVAVGADVRLHSERIRTTFIDALVEAGLKVYDLGTIPTPVAYFASFQLPIDAAVMVTASHNPPEYNGFKLGLGRSTLMGWQLLELRQRIIAGPARPPFDERPHHGTLQALDATTPYIAWMREQFAPLREAIRARGGMRVGLDCANAVGGLFYPELLEWLGCEVHGIHCRIDGSFPGHLPDPTVPEHMAGLRELVLREGLELGIGLDGDGDRLGLMDDLGRLLSGDVTTALFAREILRVRPGAPILFEVKSGQVLEDAVRALGGAPVMWKVGHSFLKTKMQELGSPLGGEVSGHFFFADRYFGYDDALYAGLRAIEMRVQAERPLSELVDELPRYCASPELHLPCGSDQRKFSLARAAVERLSQDAQVLDIDGVRVMHEDGWGLIRASNTEPVLVVRCEARTQVRMVEIGLGLLDALAELGLEVGAEVRAKLQRTAT